MATSTRRYVPIALAGALVALVILVNRSAFGFDFVTMDDDVNLVFNANIGALSPGRLAWMFTNVVQVRRYVPLGWLGFDSLYGMFGLNAGAYHGATTVAIAADTVLLFGCLVAALRRFWPERPLTGWSVVSAAIAAGLWGLSPLRAETVGWVSGLFYGQAAFFLFGSTWIYLVKVGPETTPGRTGWLGLSALLYAASLLTYPIGLGWCVAYAGIDVAVRPARTSWLRLTLEKAVFVLPALAMGLVTVVARFVHASYWGPPPTLGEFPLTSRLMQAAYQFVYYLWKPLWPTHLTPAPTTLYAFSPLEPRFLISAAVVLAVSAWLVLGGRSRPRWLAGWLAYLAVLVPVAGFSEHPHYAVDRYSLFTEALMAIATIALVSRISSAGAKAAVALAGLALLAVSAVAEARQLEMWRNTDTLYARLIGEAQVAQVKALNLSKWSNYRASLGDMPGAEALFEQGIRDYPTSGYFGPKERDAMVGGGSVGSLPSRAAYQLSLGILLLQEGRVGDSHPHFLYAASLAPDLPEAISAACLSAARVGRPAEARRYQARYVLRFPNEHRSRTRLALALANADFSAGEAHEAESDLDEAAAQAQAAGDPALVSQVASARAQLEMSR